MTRDPVDLAIDIHRRAGHAVSVGALDRAEHWCRRAVRILSQHLGEGHPDTVNVSNALGAILERQSRYADAESVFRSSVGAMDALDVDMLPVHVIHAQSLTGLGNILRIQARYAEAEPILQRAIALTEAKLGATHALLADTLNNLAVLCKYTGDFERGAALYARALAVAEANHAGPEAVATIYHNLGGLAHARRDYEAGEAPARKAVELRTAALGPDHPDVAADAAALAGILEGLGRYAEARPIYERALGIYLAAYGPNHYEVGYALSALASAERALGEIESAERHYREALAIREHLLGGDHPDVGITLHNLAALLDEQGRAQEARPLSGRAVSIFETRLGDAHPTTGIARDRLASITAACP